MTTTARTKRIQGEMKLVAKQREELEKSGIFIRINELDNSKAEILIIPREKSSTDSGITIYSPYTGGVFLFQVQLPDQYPDYPPKVKFVHPPHIPFRVHPNYYKEGKVCLSIINTWQSADWVPTCNLIVIAKTLEERLNEYSIRFEPGHENTPFDKLHTWNLEVQYFVLTSILSFRTTIPPPFESWAELIREQLKINEPLFRDIRRRRSDELVRANEMKPGIAMWRKLLGELPQ